ncbi:hypothetical protein HZP82_15760 [Elizabethkingia anophelis]|nr:hypothetical protein [Elizabethkingia anophelis]MCT4106461.1 hypothetical protein [Elizabethkingia anophelis]MCT4263403.1 hypothetical protein [Elizabethkingia anophelis]
MSTQIFNGGIRLGILKAAGRESLSDEDKERLDYLESLPKNQWVDLDENGKMISREEAAKRDAEHLEKFQPITPNK